MNRLVKFEALKDHAWHGRSFAKLTAQELSLAREFIASNSTLGKGDFEYAVNRMFLDKQKPKNFMHILELLTCANSASEE